MNDEGGGSLGREQLQGEPWHYEQMKKTCKEGSKYCIYNNKGKCAYVGSEYYKEACVGKGICDRFEAKTGMPKVASKKIIKNSQIQDDGKKMNVLEIDPMIIHQQYDAAKDKKGVDNMDIEKVTSEETKESPAEKFTRLSEERTNKIIKDIRTLGKLSNKASYEYTDEQIDKIFNYLESVLKDTRESFIARKPAKEFKW